MPRGALDWPFLRDLASSRGPGKNGRDQLFQKSAKWAKKSQKYFSQKVVFQNLFRAKMFVIRKNIFWCAQEFFLSIREILRFTNPYYYTVLISIFSLFAFCERDRKNVFACARDEDEIYFGDSRFFAIFEICKNKFYFHKNTQICTCPRRGNARTGRNEQKCSNGQNRDFRRPRNFLQKVRAGKNIFVNSRAKNAHGLGSTVLTGIYFSGAVAKKGCAREKIFLGRF